jgi:hypothetical protein
MNIITANRTCDGVVVYWTGGHWSLHLTDAVLLDDDEARRAQETLLQDEVAVVAPEIEAAHTAQDVVRVRLRETIRAIGPTIDWIPLREPLADVPLR